MVYKFKGIGCACFIDKDNLEPIFGKKRYFYMPYSTLEKEAL